MLNRPFPFVLLLGFLWGTNLVASRFGVGEFHPLLFISIRLAGASLLFIPILYLTGRPLPRDRSIWLHAAISGILGIAIPMSFFFFALQFMSSGVASIFVTGSPALIAIAAHFFLPDEPLSRIKGIGVLLALAGSIFLAIRGESGLADVTRANPWGPIIILLGMCADVANTIFVRRRMQQMDPFAVTGIRLLSAAIATSIATVLFVEIDFSQVSQNGWLAVLYATVLGALAGQFLAFYITGRFGATAFSLTAYVIPLVATFFGVFLLDEIVTSGILIGVLLIGTGLYFINQGQRPPVKNSISHSKTP